MVQNSNSAASKFKYNGKEFNDELGLNMYDYGARMYDPSAGKWFSVDAMAEKYYDQSTYTYTLNNPVLYIDPDGNQVALCCWEEFIGIVKGIGKVAYDSTIGLVEPVPIPEKGSVTTKDILDSFGIVTIEDGIQQHKEFVETMKNGTAEQKTLALGGLIMSMKPGKGKGSKTGKGRGSNNRTADSNAVGDHTVVNDRGSTTYKVNDKNPNVNNKGVAFETEKRVDYKGTAHIDKKTGKKVETPHVQEKGKPVRPAIPGKDMPKNVKIDN